METILTSILTQMQLAKAVQDNGVLVCYQSQGLGVSLSQRPGDMAPSLERVCELKASPLEGREWQIGEVVVSSPILRNTRMAGCNEVVLGMAGYSECRARPESARSDTAHVGCYVLGARLGIISVVWGRCG